MIPDEFANVIVLSNLGNPASTSPGAFGGQVLAMQLNVDFGGDALLRGTAAAGLAAFLNGEHGARGRFEHVTIGHS